MRGSRKSLSARRASWRPGVLSRSHDAGPSSPVDRLMWQAYRDSTVDEQPYGSCGGWPMPLDRFPLGQLGVPGRGMGNVDRDPASSLPVDVFRDGVISTFARGGGAVYRCYSSCARGTEFLMGYYAIVDRAPDGRDEGDPPMSWLRRHDESPHQ